LSRAWDSVEERKEQLHQSKIPLALEDLKNFVKDYLEDCHGTQKAFEIEKNEMTYAVLRLVETLINYGFYKTEDDLIQVLDPMISLMDGSKDVSSEDEEAIIYDFLQKKKKKD
jgi:hypothetical protein